MKKKWKRVLKDGKSDFLYSPGPDSARFGSYYGHFGTLKSLKTAFKYHCKRFLTDRHEKAPPKVGLAVWVILAETPAMATTRRLRAQNGSKKALKPKKLWWQKLLK